MNNPYNQQPNSGQPQQPWGPPPAPKRKTGRRLGLGCASILGLFVIIAIVAAIAGGGSDDSSESSTASDKPAAAAPQDDTPAAAPTPAASHSKTPPAKAKPHPKPKPKVVTFKVWGTAPAGALGGLDITYGSDSDTRQGSFSNGTFTKTLPLDDDAMYYSIDAQLQGSGDINCSVTVDGKTKKGHASGGYNICMAQLNGGLFGGWE